MSNYGYIPSKDELMNQAKKICDCLGYGINQKAHLLILGTATTETGLGTIKDLTVGAGMGICQFDNCEPYFPFDDLKKRSIKYRDKILAGLGIDISLVEWEHLRYNTFLSLLFCRLHYLPLAETIPETVENRAKYWKKYYNTVNGKGTPEHYIEMNKEFGVDV